MHDRLVTVATFDSPTAAQLARNHLAAADIPAVLLDEESIAMDWLLSNAVGGIKLQVAAADVERAEFLLAHRPAAELAEDAPPTAVAAPATAAELAEDRRAEEEERNPSNQLADRALKAALGGLVFFPLHFYALWVLAQLRAAETRVSPGRRWKVWVAAVVNYPLLTLAFLAVSALAPPLAGLLGDPDRPRWEPYALTPFDQAVWVQFPRPPQWDIAELPTAAGPIDVRHYGAALGDRRYALTVYRYPPALAGLPPRDLLPEAARAVVGRRGGQVRREADVALGPFPGKELRVDAGGGASRTRMYLVDGRLYELSVAGRPDALDDAAADRFLASFVLD